MGCFEAVTLVLVGVWTCHIDSVCCMNLDVANPLVISDVATPSSRFGFSLAFRDSERQKWLLVGAPRANSSSQPTLQEPGVLFRCNLRRWNLPRCEPVPLDIKGNVRNVSVSGYRYKERKSNQFLSAAIDVSPDGNSVVACAPLWSNGLYANYLSVYLANGACYLATVSGGDIDNEDVVKILPLLYYKNQTLNKEAAGVTKKLPFFAMGETGLSTHFAKDGTLLMGSPGLDEWSGAVIHYKDWNPEIMYGPTDPQLRGLAAYLGYALTSGYYFSTRSLLYVASAPRYELRGQVLLYKPTGNNMDVEIALQGSEVGSFFGATLCTLDINMDDLDELLVGAPYQGSHDEGAVHVFWGSSQGRFEDSSSPIVLHGGHKPNALFGSSVASAGDLNQDGYRDVVIGAPYEDDHKGAVYIYHGSATGIETRYSQRISLADTHGGLTTFGFSLAAGVDVDNNGYPDIAIGAYASDSVVLLRSRPVVHLNVALSAQPRIIPRNVSNVKCPDWQGKHAICVRLTARFLYRDILAPQSVEVNYTAKVDVVRTQAGAPPRAALYHPGSQIIGSTFQRTLAVSRGQPTDDGLLLVFQKMPQDILNPIAIEVDYSLVHGDDPTDLHPVLAGNKFVDIKIEFDKDCGHDERCVTDLTLAAKVIGPNRAPYVICGDPRNFRLDIQIENNGDHAYLTGLIIEFSGSTRYVGFVRENGTRVLACRLRDDVIQYGGQGDQSRRDLSPRDSLVYCEVGNPVTANSIVHFQILFESSEVDEAGVLEFRMRASTLSDDLDLDNNNVTLSVPLQYEYTLDMLGLSVPDQLDIPEDGTENKVVVHQLELLNRGPGTTPTSVVDVRVPVRSDEGDLLDLKPIEMAVEGSVREIIRCREDDTQPQVSIGQLTFGKARETILDCYTAKCVTYSCDVPSLHIDQHVVIYLQMDINMHTMAKYTDSLEIILVTEAAASPADGSDGHEQGNSTLSAQVRTHLHPLELPSVIQWWIVGAAAGAGILFLLVIVLVMYKVGFFKREEHEELKRLLDERENNPYPTENNYTLDGDGEAAGVVGATACSGDDYYEEPVVDHIYEEVKHANGASRFQCGSPGGDSSFSRLSSVTSPGACADDRILLPLPPRRK